MLCILYCHRQPCVQGLVYWLYVVASFPTCYKYCMRKTETSSPYFRVQTSLSPLRNVIFQSGSSTLTPCNVIWCMLINNGRVQSHFRCESLFMINTTSLLIAVSHDEVTCLLRWNAVLTVHTQYQVLAASALRASAARIGAPRLIIEKWNLKKIM